MNIGEQVFANAARNMVQKLEAEITAVVDEFCHGCSLADIAARCTIIRRTNNPVETFCIDGMPLLEIWPIELVHERTGQAFVIRCTRKIRRLQAP